MNRVVYLMLFFLCCFCFLTCKTRFFVDKDNIEALSAVDSNQGYGPTLVEQCFDSKSPFVPTQFFEDQKASRLYLHESTITTYLKANLIFPQVPNVINIFLADHMIHDPNILFIAGRGENVALHDKDLDRIAKAMTSVHKANGIGIMSDRLPPVDGYITVTDARILSLLS